jgi:hypothetical protein
MTPQALIRRVALAAASCLAAAGCGAPLAVQSRYAGDMQGCTTGGTARATLVRQADRFSFAPTDGTLVISGTVAPDGSFTGALVTNPSRHDQEGRTGTAAQPFTLTVAGHLDDGAATGTYVTPRCRAAFRLPRVAATLAP